MTKPGQSLGGRLPLADPATLTSAQRDLLDTLKATWVAYANQLGVQATTEDGRLIGAFNAFLLQPRGDGEAPSSWPRANLVGAGLLG